MSTHLRSLSGVWWTLPFLEAVRGVVKVAICNTDWAFVRSSSSSSSSSSYKLQVATIAHTNSIIYLLDVVSLSEHDVIAVRAVNVQVDLSNVWRPAVSSRLHLLGHRCQHRHHHQSPMIIVIHQSSVVNHQSSLSVTNHQSSTSIKDHQ